MKAKTSKALAVFLAAFMAVSCTACGTQGTTGAEQTTEEETPANTTVPSIVVHNETLTEAITSAVQTVSETITSATSSQTETSTETTQDGETEVRPPSAASDFIKSEEAVEIARKGYEALVNKNYEDAVRYTNLDFIYYMAKNGEWASEETIIRELEEAEAAGEDTSIIDYSQIENVEFGKAELLSDEEVEEYNIFIPSLAEDSDESFPVDYEITDIYKVNITYDVAEGIADYDVMETPYFLVMNTRSGWKLDICIATLKEMFSMFEGYTVPSDPVYEPDPYYN